MGLKTISRGSVVLASLMQFFRSLFMVLAICHIYVIFAVSFPSVPHLGVCRTWKPEGLPERLCFQAAQSQATALNGTSLP